MNQADLDNHANQLNPDHEEYHHCREQPEHNYYESDSSDSSDSEDDERFNYGNGNYVAPTIPEIRIINPNTIRWGVKYDKNIRYEYGDQRYHPKDVFPDYAIIIQQWWQHVKRYREKNIADKQMCEALRTLNKIRSNRARISEAERLIKSLRVETSQLQTQFRTEIDNQDLLHLRMPKVEPDEWFKNRKNLYYSWPHPRCGQPNYVAFGEELIKEWSVRHLMYRYNNRPMFRSMYDLY